ncbi:hypothetical protein ACFO6V_07200 [Promicromonospora alba]|uniref:Uncharacterized protein n=1 Tax=Promicromonospora alba TaxID=1616110 RepID=A0ABV9HD14_9MICO
MITLSEDPFDGLIGEYADRPTMNTFSAWEDTRVLRKSDPGMNVRMLMDDIGMQALPYGPGASRGFSVSIGEDEEAVAVLIRNAIPAHVYHSGHGWDGLRDYVQSAVHRLLQGHLFLEIEYFRPSDTPEAKPVAFRIEILQPELIRHRFGRYALLVPERSTSTEEPHRSAVPIKAENLVVARLPRALRRDLKRMLELLRMADNDLDVMSDFTMGRHGLDTGFDFAEHQRGTQDIVLKGTRRIGWTGRGVLTDDLLDPERAWRAIQFARFVVELRNIALSALQETVDRAGAEIGFTAQLEVSGVLQPPDLDRLEAALTEGTLPMAELRYPRRRTPFAP